MTRNSADFGLRSCVLCSAERTRGRPSAGESTAVVCDGRSDLLAHCVECLLNRGVKLSAAAWEGNS
ncbi:hypothetical protein B484DRAFT_459844 [Ochromonadaceae sp. CCMP2298]|nr:hypothetical protein B484DRAFT_459844 [Ochromonadaceae sp. CCMP2298]